MLKRSLKYYSIGILCLSSYCHADTSAKKLETRTYYPPTLSNISVNYHEMDLDDIKKFTADHPSGIIISSLEMTDLPEDTKNLLREKFATLKKYGNFSKNKRTHEFKNINTYRKYVDLNRPLAFKPTTNEYLEKNFDLTGKYFSGSYSSEEGHDSYTRLYENPLNGQKIELVETYLNPKNNSTIQIFTEALNKNINHVGISWEALPFERDMIYSASFATNQRHFSLSTFRLNQADVEKLIFSIIEALNSPNSHENSSSS